MTRITQKMLQTKLDYLNNITGNKVETHTKKETGHETNIGNYHLDFSYCGIAVHQYYNTQGGISVPFGCGHVTKRELFDLLCAYIDGVDVVKSA